MDRELPFSPNGRLATKKPLKPKPPPPKPSDPLLAAYDELNAAWNEAEEDFAAMRVPVCVSYQVSKTLLGHPDGPYEGESTVCLEWTRPPQQNQWRICRVKHTQRIFVDHDECEYEAKPIAECPMETRVDMAKELAALRKQMKEARANYLPQVVDAIATIRKTLAE